MTGIEARPCRMIIVVGISPFSLGVYGDGCGRRLRNRWVGEDTPLQNITASLAAARPRLDAPGSVITRFRTNLQLAVASGRVGLHAYAAERAVLIDVTRVVGERVLVANVVSDLDANGFDFA